MRRVLPPTLWMGCLFVLQGLQEENVFLFALCKALRCLIWAGTKCCRKTNMFFAVILKFSVSSICLTHGEPWTHVPLYQGWSAKRGLLSLVSSTCSSTTALSHLLPCHFLTFHIFLCYPQILKSIHVHHINLHLYPLHTSSIFPSRERQSLLLFLGPVPVP